MREKTAINLTGAVKPMVVTGAKGEVFHKFDWKPEEYDVCKFFLLFLNRKEYYNQRKVRNE